MFFGNSMIRFSFKLVGLVVNNMERINIEMSQINNFNDFFLVVNKLMITKIQSLKFKTSS